MLAKVIADVAAFSAKGGVQNTFDSGHRCERFHMGTSSVRFRSQTRAFRPCVWPAGRLQAHSSVQPLQTPTSRHPQTEEREQCVQLHCVLDQLPVAHFCMPELALDDSKRVFLFHGKVRQAEQLLQEMNTQYGRDLKGRAFCVGSWCVGGIRDSNSVHGTTRSISSRNTALRVCRVLRLSPSSCWVMTLLFVLRIDHAIWS